MITAQLSNIKHEPYGEINFLGICDAVISWCNSPMDRYDARRRNLQLLIDQFGGRAGGQRKLAERLEMKPPQVSRWATGAQNINDQSAALIEQKLGLDYLWMDQERHMNPVVAKAVQAMMDLSPEKQVDALHWIRVEVSRQGHPDATPTQASGSDPS